MKKTFLITLLALLSTICFSQDGGTIRFLGIPIDGTKAQFSAKLKGKGFTYDSVYETFKGEFNGKNVDVYIHTNHNLVDRVYVAFHTTSASDVIYEFNRLLKQFTDTGKYVDLGLNQKISDDEDIAYEITVHGKRYQASFCYYDPDRDRISLFEALIDKFTDFYTAEQRKELKEYFKELYSAPEEEQEALREILMAKMLSMVLEQDESIANDQDRSILFMETYLDAMTSLADGDVWFMIQENYGQYYIGLYYDNLHNQAHGEDL